VRSLIRGMRRFPPRSTNHRSASLKTPLRFAAAPQLM